MMIRSFLTLMNLRAVLKAILLLPTSLLLSFTLQAQDTLPALFHPESDMNVRPEKPIVACAGSSTYFNFSDIYTGIDVGVYIQKPKFYVFGYLDVRPYHGKKILREFKEDWYYQFNESRLHIGIGGEKQLFFTPTLGAYGGVKALYSFAEYTGTQKAAVSRFIVAPHLGGLWQPGRIFQLKLGYEFRDPFTTTDIIPFHRIHVGFHFIIKRSKNE